MDEEGCGRVVWPGGGRDVWVRVGRCWGKARACVWWVEGGGDRQSLEEARGRGQKSLLMMFEFLFAGSAGMLW